MNYNRRKWRSKLVKEFYDFCIKKWYNEKDLLKIDIKEKYWWLRIDPFLYWVDEETRDKIIEIENRSEETCYICWEPWTQRDESRIVTLCDNCYKKYKNIKD